MQFSADGGSTVTNSFDVVNGSTVDISVFIADSGSSILATEGLIGFGLAAETSTIANGAIESTTINPDFEIQSVDSSASGFVWEAFTLTQILPTGPPILLGEFRFEGTSIGTTNVTFSDPLPGTGTQFVNTLSGTGQELDELIFGPGATEVFEITINTTDIPEPNCGLVILILLTTGACSPRRFRAIAK